MADIEKSKAGEMSFTDMRDAAEMVAASGLFPNFDTAAKVFTIMGAAQAEGNHPMKAMERYDLIEGRLAKRPVAMLSDFQAAGGKVEWHEYTATIARATFRSPNGDTMAGQYTIEDAQRAGLTGKANWRKYPAQMLRQRLIGDVLRVLWPAATGLAYTPEEVQSFGDDAPQRDATPPTPTSAPAPESNPDPRQFDGDAQVASATEPDYSVVPAGAYQGQPWSALADDVLSKFRAWAAAKPERSGYLQAIDAVLAARQAEVDDTDDIPMHLDNDTEAT